ncbi:hypothetical protein [Hydromonas duriensis]|uniref:Neurotransmitter-gated ion-channel n=1 Tax=Hydromonas duriensis TaxID=1527608 RepID=A0A4R6Y753_9BURK|nr:hypothetical protein [Hydromonas duriensis]TDR30992.1 neurotransmitter-gated ion-channel [Hydromonas duriensis]
MRQYKTHYKNKLIWLVLGLYWFVGVACANALTLTMPDEVKREVQQAAPVHMEEVKIGVYLNDVQSIDLKLHNYMVDFYIWFKWKNPEINPADTMEFVNHSESWSTVMSNSFEKPELLPDGSLYQVKHIQGKLSRKMDLHNYPFDKQIIQVVIEDAANESNKMRYVVEKVSVNSELKLPGFLYKQPSLVAQDYTHQTDFGDPRTAASTYSRISLELPIERPHVNAFMKNILPILLAVVCCSLAFLLHPSLVDSRFQIAVVSLLSIVALQMTSSQDLPTIEYMTLLDNLYVIGYFYCICVVAALTMSTKLAHIHDGESDPQGMKQAIRFDRLMGVMCLLVYMAMTLYTMRPLFFGMLE